MLTTRRSSIRYTISGRPVTPEWKGERMLNFSKSSIRKSICIRTFLDALEPTPWPSCYSSSLPHRIYVRTAIPHHQSIESPIQT
jgi:hypothetical protein